MLRTHDVDASEVRRIIGGDFTLRLEGSCRERKDPNSGEGIAVQRWRSILICLAIVAAAVVSGLAIPASPARGTSAPADTLRASTRPPANQAAERRLAGEGAAAAAAPSRGSVRIPGPPSPRQADETRLALLPRLCASLEIVPLPGNDRCTHGPDPAPSGYDVTRSVIPLPESETDGDASAPDCDGDGQSGIRVQVLYVRASDVASRYTAFMPSIRAWASAADDISQTSGAETGEARGLRFVHDGDCRPVVQEVVVPPGGDDGFADTVAALKKRGYNRSDRMYLSFVDTTAAGIRGIGSIWNDDRPGRGNRNGSGPSHSRVDAGCWSGDAAVHELMHNLGGVQLSAPNSSAAFHCIDEYEIMCYADSPQAPAMRYDCPLPTQDKLLFDRGNQDYFHTDPPKGSYLANHWNPAQGSFLIGGGNPPTLDDDGKREKNKKTNKQKKNKRGKDQKRRGRS